MHPKMFARLHEKMEEWWESELVEHSECESVFFPPQLEIHLARLVETAYDLMIQTARYVEEITSEDEDA